MEILTRTPGKKSEPRKKVVNFNKLFLNTNAVDKQLPNEIVISLNEDYDIVELDAMIKSKLDNDKINLLKEYKEELDKCNIERKSAVSIVQQGYYVDLERELLRKIENLEQNRDKIKYIEYTKNIVERYKNIPDVATHHVFGVEKKDKVPQEKLDCISRFVDIARKYITINYDVYTCSNECPGCGFERTDDEDERFCPNCSLEINTIKKPKIVLEGTDVIPYKSGKNNIDRDNFYKTMMCFQGKQPDKINPLLYTKLDEYFIKLQYPSGDTIKEYIREGTHMDEIPNKKLLLKAMAETGFSDCYEDLNLVAYNYWGMIPPDISHLEDSLLELFDITQQAIERLRTKKKSAPNRQYRLFQQLQMLGYTCNKDDFKIISTRDTLEALENNWREVVSECGLTFIPII